MSHQRYTPEFKDETTKEREGALDRVALSSRACLLL
jgi:hypothetical protein